MNKRQEFARKYHTLIRTSHEMYKSGDGLNHQANLSIHVNTKTMTILESFYKVAYEGGYASHSFNQFIQVDGDTLIALDHGDAYPRSLVISRFKDGISSGAPMSGDYERVNVIKFPGETGYNYTDCTVGAFEVSENNYIVAGVYNKNVFVATVPKDNFTDSAVSLKYITNYKSDSSMPNTIPFLVKMADNQYMLLWQKSGNVVHYVTIDQNGKKLSPSRLTNGSLSACPPVLVDGRPVWYYTDDSAPVFCYPVERPKYSGTITGTVGYRKQLSTASVTFPQVKDAEGNVVAGEWSFNKPDQIIKTTGTKTVYATYKCQNSAAYDDIKNAKVTLTIQGSILAQPMKVTVKNKKVSAAKLKKKSVTLKVLTVKNAKGKVTYKITDGNKKSKKALKIDSKTGKIKVKKKTKKGTYKVKVKVTAAGNDYYYAGYKTVKVSIKVK